MTFVPSERCLRAKTSIAKREGVTIRFVKERQRKAPPTNILPQQVANFCRQFWPGAKRIATLRRRRRGDAE